MRPLKSPIPYISTTLIVLSIMLTPIFNIENNLEQEKWKLNLIFNPIIITLFSFALLLYFYSKYMKYRNLRLKNNGIVHKAKLEKICYSLLKIKGYYVFRIKCIYIDNGIEFFAKSELLYMKRPNYIFSVGEKLEISESNSEINVYIKDGNTSKNYVELCIRDNLSFKSSFKN